MMHINFIASTGQKYNGYPKKTTLFLANNLIASWMNTNLRDLPGIARNDRQQE
jgi:hypothetical protein